ncbi:MAG: epoxyqueuosine reductase QueH [Alphaproteobacteria bacterium]
MKDNFLLLSCCAPCSVAVIKTLAEQNAKFAVVFYNPNIVPETEYVKRRDENAKVCELYNVPFIELEYDNNTWCNVIKGYENEPERGKRCSLCFAMRLKRTMEYAKENGFSGIASVLGASRYKNLQQVNEAAHKMSLETGVEYFEIEARRGGMQELSNKLRIDLNLYHQDYCGCKPR